MYLSITKMQDLGWETFDGTIFVAYLFT